MITRYPVTFEVRELIAEEVFDQDEDNYTYSYFDVIDYEIAGKITVYVKDENDDCGIADLVAELRNKGFIYTKVNISTKDDGLSYQVYKLKNEEPLLELVLT